MVHFELREVVGSQKLMKALDKKCPEIVPKISRSEATHIVEQVFRVLREYRLEYVIALDMLDQFERGHTDTIQIHATKRNRVATSTTVSGSYTFLSTMASLQLRVTERYALGHGLSLAEL